MYHHADYLGMMVFVVYSRCQAFLRLTRSFGRGGRVLRYFFAALFSQKKTAQRNNASELLKVLVAGAGFEPTTSGL